MFLKWKTKPDANIAADVISVLGKDDNTDIQYFIFANLPECLL